MEGVLSDLGARGIRIIALDMDGTLIRGPLYSTLLMQHLAAIVRHMHTIGGRVAIVTGSALASVQSRVVDHLVEALGDDALDALTGTLEVFPCGGASRYHCPSGHLERWSTPYAEHIAITPDIIPTVVETVESVIRKQSFWKEPSVIEAYRKWCTDPVRPPSDHFAEPPRWDSLSSFKVPVTTPEEVDKRQLLSPVMVEVHKEGERIVQLVVKVIPRTLEGGSREALAAALREVVPLQAMPTGFSSVNLNLANQGGKALALQALMESIVAVPSEVLFIGDEIVPRGNDLEVTTVEGALCIHVGEDPSCPAGTLHAPSCYNNLVGPPCTENVFRDLLAVWAA